MICMVIFYTFLLNSYGQIPEKIQDYENVDKKESRFKKDYEKFLENQKTPFSKADGEVFVLDGAVWERKYGEKDYILVPMIQDISEYKSRIRRLDDPQHGIIKSKHYIINVEVTAASKTLLKSMNINIPDHIQNTVNVYLPEIDIDELGQIGITFNYLKNYGESKSKINKSGTNAKIQKTVIWNEGFESSFPGSTYTVVSDTSVDCTWDDVSCVSHFGSWSVWCADFGLNCNSSCTSYLNNMSADFEKFTSININCYTDVYFKFWSYFNLSSINDVVERYYNLGSGWVLSSTQYNGSHAWNNTGWNQASFLYSGNNPSFNFRFDFTSNFSGTSDGVYLDDLELSGTSSGQPSSATVTGASSACQGSAPTYTASATGATSYSWSLPSGWSGSSTSNTITVTVGSSSGNICVTPSNSCGTGTQGCNFVTVTPLPSSATISGSSTTTCGSTQSYTASASGATSYSWNCSGSCPCSGSGSSTNVFFPSAGTCSITATPSNSCGTGPSGTISVTVGAGGPATATISGTSIASLDSILNYSASSSNATSFNWVVPNSWSILSGQGTSNITVSTNNSYQTICATSADVCVTPSNTCGSGTQQCFTVSVQHPKCLITVDSTSTKNIIVWEKPISSSIDSFIIYREVTTNNYQQIGSLAYNELSEFIDTTPGINPNTTSYRYKISFSDTCGNESVLSNFHKTIHLTVLTDVNGKPFLTWTDYEGFIVSQYNILRDDFGTGNWDSIYTVAAGINTWTDQNPPTDSSVYRIEAIPPSVCIATLTSAKAKNYNTSKSNYANKLGTTGVPNLRGFENLVGLSAYPNPYTGKTTITYILPKNANVSLEIYNIIGEKIHTLANENQNAGKYQYEFSAEELRYGRGVYLLKLRVNETNITKLLLELR